MRSLVTDAIKAAGKVEIVQIVYNASVFIRRLVYKNGIKRLFNSAWFSKLIVVRPI